MLTGFRSLPEKEKQERLAAFQLAETSKLICRKRIKALRQKKKWSQDQLAFKIGARQSDVCHYERGDRTPGFDSLIKLAFAFNVSLDYLTGIKDE